MAAYILATRTSYSRPPRKVLQRPQLSAQRSDFFHAALQPDAFVEGLEQVVRLPDDRPLVFACYFEWLYRGDAMNSGLLLYQALKKYPCPDKEVVEAMNMDDLEEEVNLGDTNTEHNQRDACHLPGPTNRRYSFPLQFACYVFGDKSLNREFKIHMMKEMSSTGLGKYKDPTVETIEYAYDNTVKQDDPLRAYCMRALFSTIPTYQALKDKRVLELIARPMKMTIFPKISLKDYGNAQTQPRSKMRPTDSRLYTMLGTSSCT